jgi:hypothetical protein
MKTKITNMEIINIVNDAILSLKETRRVLHEGPETNHPYTNALLLAGYTFSKSVPAKLSPTETVLKHVFTKRNSPDAAIWSFRSGNYWSFGLLGNVIDTGNLLFGLNKRLSELNEATETSTIRFTKTKEKCPECSGKRYGNGDSGECETCNGAGNITVATKPANNPATPRTKTIVGY